MSSCNILVFYCTYCYLRCLLIVPSSSVAYTIAIHPSLHHFCFIHCRAFRSWKSFSCCYLLVDFCEYHPFFFTLPQPPDLTLDRISHIHIRPSYGAIKDSCPCYTRSTTATTVTNCRQSAYTQQTQLHNIPNIIGSFSLIGALQEARPSGTI